MTNPTPLSLAAQAVVAAIEKFDWESGHFSREEIWDCSREVVAAALRAVVEHLSETHAGFDLADKYGRFVEADDILAIAAELEAQ